MDRIVEMNRMIVLNAESYRKIIARERIRGEQNEYL